MVHYQIITFSCELQQGRSQLADRCVVSPLLAAPPRPHAALCILKCQACYVISDSYLRLSMLDVCTEPPHCPFSLHCTFGMRYTQTCTCLYPHTVGICSMLFVCIAPACLTIKCHVTMETYDRYGPLINYSVAFVGESATG